MATLLSQTAQEASLMSETLPRCQGQLPGISHQTVRKMNLSKYLERLRILRDIKQVYIVDEHDWSEQTLSNWFKQNYSIFGFCSILEERTEEYNTIKAQLGFSGWPDFLCLRENVWLRVELECFSSRYRYMHRPDYADIVIAYEIDEKIPNVET